MNNFEKQQRLSKKMDAVLNYITANSALMISAQDKLGIPISESIAYAARHFEKQQHIEKLQDSIDATTDHQ